MAPSDHADPVAFLHPPPLTGDRDRLVGGVQPPRTERVRRGGSPASRSQNDTAGSPVFADAVRRHRYIGACYGVADPRWHLLDTHIRRRWPDANHRKSRWVGHPGDYSPDGKRLVFVRQDPTGRVGLFVIDIDGRGQLEIPTPGMILGFEFFAGSWSPVGDEIVFSARRSGTDRHAI